MKKLLTMFAAILLILSGCQKDDYQKGPGGSGSGGGGETKKAERVDGRVVLGYCTYYGSLVPDGSVVTNINYGFAELYVKDGEYQGFKLQGDESRFRKVISVKEKYPDVKISLSFTHTVSNSDNAQGGGFSVMASTEEGRKKFAKDCLSFCQKWGIDGIDIDWEFPGLSWSGHACNPAIDTDNFTLLMKQLRETLGNRYLLTYAGYVMDMKTTDDGGKKYIDIKAVDPYVDFVNIMTYDIASGAAGQHQSAWDRPDYYYDCKRAVNSYLNAGIDPGKLVMGIPFYARHAWDNSDGYKGCVDYKNFSTEYPESKGFKTDNWDEKGEVPYVTLNGKMHAGYDNPKSIDLKAEKIIKLGMKGLMYWDYDADDTQGTLRNAVWNSVMSK